VPAASFPLVTAYHRKIRIARSDGREGEGEGEQREREARCRVGRTWMKVRSDLWISLSGLEYITRRRWRKKNEENGAHLFSDLLKATKADYYERLDLLAPLLPVVSLSKLRKFLRDTDGSPAPRAGLRASCRPFLSGAVVPILHFIAWGDRGFYYTIVDRKYGTLRRKNGKSVRPRSRLELPSFTSRDLYFLHRAD